jgi:holo-[acyl-carrier protein] synthase
VIYGIGTDLVDPARIARSLEKYGERFARRLLTDNEWTEYSVSHKQPTFLASRFAAKEAFSKAMGTGLRHPVNLSSIGIMHDALGKPYLEFHSELKQFIKSKGINQHFLSISDEVNLVCAFVILEK